MKQRMKQRETRVKQVRRALLGLCAVLGLWGCSAPVPADARWIPWAELDGPLRPEAGPPPVPGGAGGPTDRLRIASYNVHFGADVDGIAAALRGNPALARVDVLLVQEIESHPSESRSRPARLAERLGMTWVYAPSRAASLDGGAATGTHGIAILSRRPLLPLAVMHLPEGLEPRLALAVDVQLGPGAALRVINIHLDTRLNFLDRLRQIRPAVLGAPARVVVGGDLNVNDYLWAGHSLPVLPVDAAGPAEQPRLLDSYMRALGFATPTSELGPTLRSVPAAALGLRLDALYTRGLAVTPGAVERGVTTSDHDPLWIDVAGL